MWSIQNTAALTNTINQPKRTSHTIKQSHNIHITQESITKLVHNNFRIAKNNNVMATLESASLMSEVHPANTERSLFENPIRSQFETVSIFMAGK